MQRRNALRAAALLLAGAGLAGTAKAAPGPHPARRRQAALPWFEGAGGVRLYYQDWGQGETAVVFVHGWPLTGALWQYQMLHLASAGVRAIAYDQRGCGRSPDPGTGNDFDTLADDLAALIDQLDLRRVVLVGHSIGCGQIVRYLGRHGGARVKGVVLLSASLPYIQRAPDNPDGIDPAHFDLLRRYIAGDPAKWLGSASKTFFTPETSPDMVRWAVDACLQNSIWAMTQTSHIDTETDFRRELPTLRVRTLVVHGDGDLTCPLETTGRRVAQLIPGAELKVYPGAKHGLFLTHMEPFNRDLLAFTQQA
jgi:non-heme chloroperoxidase